VNKSVRKILFAVVITSFIFVNFSFSIGGINTKNNIENTSSFGELIVYFIDVGQGDCILIQTPENYFVLIDAGSRSYANTVIDFLSHIPVFTIDAFILTHPHEDHIGGADEILYAFDVLSVYHPGYHSESQTYQRFINAAENEGCPIYTDYELDPGDYLNLGSFVTFQILHINKDASNANDAGIVLRVDYSLMSFLFTGDITGNGGDHVESDLVNNWNVDVDVLKVAHHGSKHSSTNYFLAEATPTISVICVGAGNSYGHPHQEALTRLSWYSTYIHRTDLNGDIAISTDGYSWSIFYEKPEEKPFPPTVTGETYGTTGMEYMYKATAFDPNSDHIYYKWDWGDGTETEWDGPYFSGEECYQYHTFNENGTYIIKVKAKDSFNLESDWGMLSVVMPKNKIRIFQNFVSFFEIWKNLFQNLIDF
jgi:beta-lactamase superfamily II metal-dependent hydrolase